MESSRTQKRIVIAILVLLLLIIGGALFLWVDNSRNKSAQSPTTQPLPETKTNVIKVGWMASEWTMDEHPYGKVGNTENVAAIRPRLDDAELEIVAIIEPGTENTGVMPQVLKKYFKGKYISGTDVDKLSKLDVIVCSRDWNMKPEVMQAILKAVNNGVGLFRHLGLGIRLNGDDDDDTARINCVDDPKFFWTRDPIDCRICSDHELLGGIDKSTPDKKLTISNVNGVIGIVHGTPLIVAEEGAEAHGEIADGLPATQSTSAPTDKRIFCPMFISQIGKGRVVACQWDSIPRPLIEATKGRFYIRCVEWLAHRPLK